MRRIIISMSLFFIFLISGCAPRYQVRPNTKAPKEYVDTDKSYLNEKLESKGQSYDEGLAILKKYCPDGFYIIHHGTLIKSKRYRSSGLKYLLGLKEKGFHKINVTVHEKNHAYNGMFLPKKIEKGKIQRFYGSHNYQAFYIDNGRTTLVKKTKTFPAREIASIYPEYIKKDKKLSFRYRGYIIETMKDQSTQKEGVYGLLDEFNSYYQGTKAAFQLLPYFKTFKNLQKSINYYFSQYYSTDFAYGEFKLFILTYLIYAEKNYPEIFREIMNNKNFIRTFFLIDENYAQLLKDFEAQTESIRNWLKTRGFKLHQSEDGLWVNSVKVDPKAGTYRLLNRASFEKQLKIHLKELKKEKYKRMIGLMKQSLESGKIEN